MKISNLLKLSSSLLISAAFFTSSNAAAALNGLPLQVSLNTAETLAPLESSPTRCAPGTAAIAIGMTGGTGNMTIATGPGPQRVTIPVVLAASDCPTQAFSFSDGRFVLYASNGSMLSATYHGEFGFTSATTLVMDQSLSAFAITGGTGFFSGASGTGQLGGGITIVRETPFLGIGTLTGNGTVSFSSSNFEKHFKIRPNK